WTTTNLKELGVQISIPKAARLVLNGLRKKGFEVYLVGGCVRDVIMKRPPKDFDVLTTAELREVKQIFSRCEIVGKRFPICHVHVNDSIIEVSSFSTCGRKSINDLNYSLRPPDCDDHDYLRWRNCLRRDFTINGLMLNPFSNRVHDYFGGIKDLKKAKVQTVIPPRLSFTEDCARILRAIRVAARLDFNFSRETAHSIVDLANSVLRLDKGRLLMEINYMFAYGSAQSSLRMLWRFGLLELLLPIQAAYFASQGFRRRDKRTNMLLALFSNLDSHLAPDRPCHNSLWIALLAFHQALVQKPQDPLVIAVFIFALSNGGDLTEAIKIAKAKTHPPDVSFPELLQPQEWCTDEELVNEVLDLASSMNTALSSMTDEYHVAKAMARYPQAPFSDLVFIPLQSYLSVCRVFECVGRKTKESGYEGRRRHKLNYSNLASGSLPDVRFALSQVVLDTLYPPKPKNVSCEDLPED
ncbi:uncharacterized protein A4U43_C02F16080, partial [Asparagus officinalis]